MSASGELVAQGRETSWDEVEASVGTEVGAFVGADAVSLADIRRRLEVLAWDCPLHYDEAIARRYGYRTVVAPVSMHLSAAFPAYWSPGEPRPTSETEVLMPRIPLATDVGGTGDRIIDTGFDVQYGEPLYPGDSVSAVSRLAKVTRKRTRIGDGAFVVVETTYTKQSGAEVAVDQLTAFRGRSSGAATGPNKRSASPTPPPTAVDAAAVARGIRLDSGASLPGEVTAFTLPLTRQRLVMEAAVNRDFFPVHFEDAAARENGLDGAFSNGIFLEALYEATLRDWMGLGGRLRRLAVRMIVGNVVGHTITCSGHVARTSRQGDCANVDVSMHTVLDGVVTSSAEASVVIPHSVPPFL